MSFVVALQTAPERRGLTSTNDVSSWSTSPVLTYSGTYLGAVTKTFTLTSPGAGLIGTTSVISVTWADGLGNTGTLDFGTDHSYAAGTVIALADGISVAAAAGTFVAGTQTLLVVAANQLPLDHQIMTGDLDPVDFTGVEMEASSTDETFQAHDGRSSLERRAELSSVSALVDYLDDAVFDKMRWWRSRRAELTFGENYDASTKLLWRGGTADPLADGLLPFIGPYVTFTRSGVASYQDPRTRLFRTVAANIPRPAAGRVGRGIELGQGVTNLLPRFHPKSGTLGWSGTGTLSWDTGVRGVLDPTDPNWSTAFTGGVLRWEAAALQAIDCSNAVTVASTQYAGQVWLKGRGQVAVVLRTGAVDPPSSAPDTEVVTLTNEWQRVALQGASGVGHIVGDIQLSAIEASVVYVSVSQLETGYVCSAPVQTDGASASRGAEACSVSLQIPNDEGTISFDLYWPGDSESGYYKLIETTTGGLFAIRYGAANDRLEVSTDGSGSSLNGTTDLAAGTWYHIAFSWARASASNMARKLYVNGVLEASDSSTAWAKDWGPILALCLAGGSGSPVNQHAIRIEELRIDDRALSANEILLLYERRTQDAMLNVLRECAGRKYRGRARESWLSNAHPDTVIAELSLAESNREDGSVLVLR